MEQTTKPFGLASEKLTLVIRVSAIKIRPNLFLKKIKF